MEGKSSDSAKVTSGIPQGSMLCPIQFLIFTNDLHDVIDAKLFGRVNSTIQGLTVQISFDIIQDFSDDKSLFFIF